MKRSQLKSLIKECLIEILKDDKLLEHAVNGALLTPRIPMIQQNLRGKQVEQNSGRNLALLAGLNETSEPINRSNRNPNHKTPGVRNPSDYLELAMSRQAPFNPELDSHRGLNRTSTQNSQLSANSGPNSADAISGISPEVMRQIYSDTAQKTLVEQASAGHISPGYRPDGLGDAMTAASDEFDRLVSQNDPIDIFGSSAKNWGALAFGKS